MSPIDPLCSRGVEEERVGTDYEEPGVPWDFLWSGANYQVGQLSVAGGGAAP
jgi:hypothetical protein